jgi:hypothetical protein
MKNLDKFFNKKDVPWVALIWEKHYSNGRLPNHIKKGLFWWRDILKLLDWYKLFSSVTVRRGETCRFWLDKWSQEPLQLQYPQLFSFTRNKNISVQEFCSQTPIQDLFSLPVSTEAFQQMTILQSFLDHFLLLEQDDIWKTNWGPYSASRTYKYLIGHRQIHSVFRCLWKSCCQSKHKVLF